MKKDTETKTAKEMQALVKRIDKEKPEPEDLTALKNELDRKPELARTIGNLQRRIMSEVLRDSVSSYFVSKCTERFIEDMKNEFGYQSSTFVEKMLIDEIVMRWLRLQVIESDHKRVTSQSHSIQEGVYMEKRLDLSQKRLLRSINSLAKVRKMIAQTQAKGAEMFKALICEK